MPTIMSINSKVEAINCSINVAGSGPGFQFSHAALLKLKDTSNSPRIKPVSHQNPPQSILNINPMQTQGIHKNLDMENDEMLHSEEPAQIHMTEAISKPNFSMNKQHLILSRKLSNMLDASPLKNSYIGKIIHDRYQNHLNQPDGTKTLSSILNETLIILKGR